MEFFNKEALADIIEPGFTVQEAIDLLLADDNELFQRDIFIAPPDINIGSDEDSGDEDLMEPGNLSRRQLQADAEVKTVSGKVYKGKPNIINNTKPELSQQPSASKSKSDPEPKRVSLKKKGSIRKIKKGRVLKKRVKKPTKHNTIIEWIKGDLQEISPEFPISDYSDFEEFTPVQLFEKFLDDNIVCHIAEETNRYAMQNNVPDPSITPDEIRCFLGILFFSSYHYLPSKRMYWEQSDDVYIPLVAEAMRRSRFEQILRFFHISNNENYDPNGIDKLWKLRPLIDMLKKRFSAYFVPEKHLSYDESMVRYFGKHSLKQFIPTKPIRFGYKVWSLNTPSGYLVDFDVYQGKTTAQANKYEMKVGKSAAPLLQMIDNFPKDIKKLPFHFYIDNLFTSFQLLSYLREKGYGATGTMRENRIPKSCPLPTNKSMKGEERGHIESIINKNDGVLLCKWRDNSVVFVCSNTHGIHPITKVGRYSFAEKKIMQVPRPCLLTEYNKGIGGTDRMDQNLNLYRIQVRNRKWYWPLISWLLNIALQNAWIIYRKAVKNISQLEFRRNVVLTYLKKYQAPTKAPGRPSSRPLGESRYDRIDHLVRKIPDGLRRRCKGEYCKSVSRYYCQKCDAGLCLDCFAPYHTRS